MNLISHSPLQSKDFRTIKDYLKNIFDNASTENLQLFFPNMGYLDVAKKLSDENCQNARTTTSTHVYILSKVENTWMEVGKINFVFRVGMSLLAKEETSHLGQEDYFAFLEFIEIYPNFQGQGLASRTLRIWHACMDKLVPLTILGVDSKVPYAALTYKKAGYEFTKKTIHDINNWYQKLPDNERILIKSPHTEILQAQNEFLADSSRMLKGVYDHAFMIRWNSNQL